MLHICITKGVDKGEQISTRQAVVSIGRSSSCDLVLNDNKVSHLHGEFLFVGSRCVYRDLLSRNGSFIRSCGETFWLGPLKSEREVKTDDEVILGSTTILLEAVLPENPRMSERNEDDFLGTLCKMRTNSADSRIMDWQLRKSRSFTSFSNYRPTMQRV